MTFHHKVHHEVESQFSPVGQPRALSSEEINAMVARGRRMRAEQFAVVGAAVGKALRIVADRLFGGFRRYVSELRAIDQLRAMDDRQLADIGISRESIAYAVHAGRGKDSRYAAVDTDAEPETVAAESGGDLKHAA